MSQQESERLRTIEIWNLRRKNSRRVATSQPSGDHALISRAHSKRKSHACEYNDGARYSNMPDVDNNKYGCRRQNANDVARWLCFFAAERNAIVWLVLNVLFEYVYLRLCPRHHHHIRAPGWCKRILVYIESKNEQSMSAETHKK